MSTNGRPSRVKDHYEFWGKPPPKRSARCQFWLDAIKRGWLPNSRISGLGYDEASQWYGVFIWEYQNEIRPAVDRAWPRCPKCSTVLSPQEVGHTMCRKCAEKDMANMLGAGLLDLPADWYDNTPEGGTS